MICILRQSILFAKTCSVQTELGYTNENWSFLELAVHVLLRVLSRSTYLRRNHESIARSTDSSLGVQLTERCPTS